MHKRVSLYSFQAKEVVESLFEDGVYFINKERSSFCLFNDLDTDGFTRCYNFIVKKMDELLKKKRNKEIVYPIWAWYKWEGKRKPTPLHNKQYEGMYRIELEIDKEDALFTDFDLFSFCLNDPYLPSSVEDLYEHREKHFSISPELTYESYNRMLEIYRKEDTDFTYATNKTSIQATFWKLHLKDVKRIVYIGKNKNTVIYKKQ